MPGPGDGGAAEAAGPGARVRARIGGAGLMARDRIRGYRRALLPGTLPIGAVPRLSIGFL